MSNQVTLNNKAKFTPCKQGTTYQICDNSKIGSLDLVKNSFAAEPGGREKEKGRASSQQSSRGAAALSPKSYVARTGDEAGEVGLNGLELVDVILPLLVGDLPGVVVGAGLSLDLVGRRRRGHCSYRCAFLKQTQT